MHSMTFKEDLYPFGVKASEFVDTVRRCVSNTIPADNEIMMSVHKVYIWSLHVSYFNQGS